MKPILYMLTVMAMVVSSGCCPGTCFVKRMDNAFACLDHMACSECRAASQPTDLVNSNVAQSKPQPVRMVAATDNLNLPTHAVPLNNNVPIENTRPQISRLKVPENTGSRIIECTMDDNVVQSIAVECSCGQRTEISCPHGD